MGYTTRFDGELKFTNEPSAKQLAKLNSMLLCGLEGDPHPCAQSLGWISLRTDI